jgi:hypothetical protein
MIIISHRGNITGPSELENSPDHVLKAFDRGYAAEVDVWMVDDKLYLGHDKPEHEIEGKFLLKHRYQLWCHAKNLEALVWLRSHDLHFFWHDRDDYTLTSQGYVWAYPKRPIPLQKAIVVVKGSQVDLGLCGVCTDYPVLYTKGTQK